MRTTADCGCTSNTGGCGCGKSGDCGCSKAIKPTQENQPWLREVVASGIRDARLKECMPSSDSRIRQSAALSLDSRLVDRSGENRIKFLVRDAGGWREDFSQSDMPELPSKELGVQTLSNLERQRLLWTQIQKEQDVRLHMLEIAKTYKESSARSLARTHPAHGIFKWPGLLYNEYGLHSISPETQGCCPVGLKVTESFNAGYGSEDPNDPGAPGGWQGEVPSMSAGINVNGYDIYEGTRPITQLVDMAHRANEYIWTQAPEQLRIHWPDDVRSGIQWDFDEKSCHWLYMSVGENDAGCQWPDFLKEDQLDGCQYNASDVGEKPETRVCDRFLVSALMPYAVYDFRNISSVKINGCTQVTYRMRFWIGVTHHFSFFLPYSYLLQKSAMECTVLDLPEECWSSDTEAISDIGIRLDAWMKMGDGCQAGIFASVPYSNGLRVTVNTAREYFCNVNDFADENQFAHDDDHYYYQRVQGGQNGPYTEDVAAAFCFSNHTAYAHSGSGNQPWRSMTSLLGINATGEVCFTLNPYDVEQLWGDLEDNLAKEGFYALFGSNPEVIFNNKFWAGPDGKDFNDSGRPHSVYRRLIINERSLVSVSEFCQKVYKLRTTDEGKWLFRSFDADRLLMAAQENINDVRNDICCP